MRGGLVALALLAFALLPTPTASAMTVTRELTDDGAWCWYSSPRALYHEGAVYTGWVTQSGDIDAAKHVLYDTTTSIVILHPQLQPDDHDHPVFYETSDGRLTAFYGKHARPGNYTLYRTTMHPWGIGSWFGENSTDVNTSGSGGTTYANPVAVPGAADTVLLFWRGGNWRPNYSVGHYTSDTATWEWSVAKTFITTESGRPYVRYAPVGDDRIGFAFTNGHPSESDSKLYYASFGENKDGQFGYFRSDGSLIGFVTEGALTPAQADIVYDGAELPNEMLTEAWVWDVAADAEGRPVVVFASFPSTTHHRYHWAIYEDGEWLETVLVENAGGSVADTTIGVPEHYYSGGIALDHTDPSIVYLSRKNEVGGWDLEQWKTVSSGRTWNVTSVAADSMVENIRPVVPVGRPPGLEMVLWMSGSYDYYKNFGYVGDDYYDTGIMLWLNDSSAGIGDPDAGSAIVLRPPSPNPSRGVTRITFDLPESAAVDLSVYDVAGRRVKRLLRSEQVGRGPTTVVWDGTRTNGGEVPSGVYFMRLSTGGRTATSKVLVLR